MEKSEAEEDSREVELTLSSSDFSLETNKQDDSGISQSNFMIDSTNVPRPASDQRSHVVPSKEDRSQLG